MSTVECEKCNGWGWVRKRWFLIARPRPCARCNGTGYLCPAEGDAVSDKERAAFEAGFHAGFALAHQERLDETPPHRRGAVSKLPESSTKYQVAVDWAWREYVGEPHEHVSPFWEGVERMAGSRKETP